MAENGNGNRQTLLWAIGLVVVLLTSVLGWTITKVIANSEALQKVGQVQNAHEDRLDELDKVKDKIEDRLRALEIKGHP